MDSVPPAVSRHSSGFVDSHSCDEQRKSNELNVCHNLVSVTGLGSPGWPNKNPPRGVAQVDLLIPVMGSAVGVDGGGVEQKDSNGSGTSRSG